MSMADVEYKCNKKAKQFKHFSLLYELLLYLLLNLI